MIDIHNHILPYIDDGSTSWETTLEMCRIAAADGIRHIVATPHADDKYSYDRESHGRLLDDLRNRMNGTLEFSLGCDFHVSFENVTALRTDPSQFCIGDTNYLLVEFSDYGVARQMISILHEILGMGLIPVITHPERNLILQRRPEIVVEMAEMGSVVQITANSLTGFWGSTAKKVSEWLLKKYVVHVLASDAHDPEHRVPVLSQARDAAASLVGAELATMLVSDNPGAIIRGEPLP